MTGTASHFQALRSLRNLSDKLDEKEEPFLVHFSGHGRKCHIKNQGKTNKINQNHNSSVHLRPDEPRSCQTLPRTTRSGSCASISL